MWGQLELGWATLPASIRRACVRGGFRRSRCQTRASRLCFEKHFLLKFGGSCSVVPRAEGGHRAWSHLAQKRPKIPAWHLLPNLSSGNNWAGTSSLSPLRWGSLGLRCPGTWAGKKISHQLPPPSKNTQN